MAKHFRLTIADDRLSFARDEAAIAKEAALDGFYVLRTSVPAATLDPAATVRAYKSLAGVERAFRALKTVDLEVRPVHHRLAGRVRAHVFLCMLAYHVIWHLRRALAPLLFDDHDRDAAAAQRASPVAAARVSPAARAKARTRRTADGQPVHSFRTLLAGSGHPDPQHPALRRRPPGRHAQHADPAPASHLRPAPPRPRAVGRAAHPKRHLPQANQPLTSRSIRKFGLVSGIRGLPP